MKKYIKRKTIMDEYEIKSYVCQNCGEHSFIEANSICKGFYSHNWKQIGESATLRILKFYTDFYNASE